MDRTLQTGTRTCFWREEVFSRAGTVIPKQIRKGRESEKWSINDIVGELLREPGHCGHVDAPEPPVHVWGLHPSQLRGREKALHENASRVTETYTRLGKDLTRAQKSSTPTLLMAIASWPSPSMVRTDERDRWERRVIRAAKSRWGAMLRSVVAHTDEGHYHLHLWVDDDGRPMKPHHAGHGAAMDAAAKGEDKAGRGTAYRRGCAMAQDWYHHWVGRSMHWARSQAPRPRLSRAAALRRRDEALEQQAAVAAAQLAKNKAEAELLRAKSAEILQHDAVLAQTAIELRATGAELLAAKRRWEHKKAMEVAGIETVLKQLLDMTEEIKDDAARDKHLTHLQAIRRAIPALLGGGKHR